MDEKNVMKTETPGGPMQAEAVTPNRRIFTPAVDIWENENEFTILANMPGVGKDGVTVDYEEGELKIYGRAENPIGENATALLNEFSSGDYSRVFRIPEVIDPEKIGAVIRDGVLRVTLPKSEKLRARKIEIA